MAEQSSHLIDLQMQISIPKVSSNMGKVEKLKEHIIMCIEQGISIDYGKDFAIDIINYPSNPTQSSSLEWDTTIEDKNLDEELAEGLDEELANGLGNDETKLRVGEEYEETSSLEKLTESKNNSKSNSLSVPNLYLKYHSISIEIHTIDV